MRGRGWRPSYPLGSQSVAPGVPLVSTLRWDTGVQARLGDGNAQLVVAVTTGTLANPRVLDDNSGKQLATRAFFRPSVGLELGISAARGDFVSDDTRRAVGETADATFAQSALGADVEYSRGHWLLRGEGMLSSWTLPAVSVPLLSDPLRAWGLTGEARYRVRPGLYVAGRLGHVGFSSVTGTRFDGRPTSWDAPVTRVEVGGGYSVTRNIMVKLAYQQNWRDHEGRRRPVGRTRFVATQLLYWF